MESLYLLIPLSVLVVFGAIALFWWMSDNGQFDDMEGPAQRILFDEEEAVATLPSPTQPPIAPTTPDIINL